MARLSRPPSLKPSPAMGHRRADSESTAGQHSLRYTLALRDGALGTIPTSHHRPPLALLRVDLPQVVAKLPSIVGAVASSMFESSASDPRCWPVMREDLLYAVTSLLELYLLAVAATAWCFMPGWLSLLSLMPLATLIWALIAFMNGQQVETIPLPEKMTKPTAKSANQDRAARLHWVVVGGIGNHAQARRTSLPRLAALFGCKMHAFLPYRLGLPLDWAVMVLQRSLQAPRSMTSQLYDHIRQHLQRQGVDGVRVIVHGTGALDMSWVVSRLCSDLPAGEHLGKLEIYTLGAASTEITVPLGSGVGASRKPPPAAKGQEVGPPAPLYPTATHFAFEEDPFAELGVLHGIRRRLEGRIIGDLFTIRSNHSEPNSPSSSTPSHKSRRLLPRFSWWRSWWVQRRRCKWTLDDYLEALFPGDNAEDGIFSQVCKIDCEVSEMRELAALARSVHGEASRALPSKTSPHKKRLSWTALGAIASNNCVNRSGLPGGQDGIVGAFSLDEVRRKGRALRGMKGYENNRLVAALAVRGAARRMSVDEACGLAVM